VVGAGWAVDVLTDLDDVEGIGPEWEELFDASAPSAIFVHPTWMTTWARRFLDGGQVVVITVRDRGSLVGVAPFYRRSVLGVHQVQLIGAGKHAYLTELPGILARPDRRRAVLRSVVEQLARQGASWDWVDLLLGPDDGWPEATRATGCGSTTSMRAYLTAGYPCVLVPLAANWDETRAGLKRNVRTTLRRGYDRLERDGIVWDFAIAAASEIRSGIDSIARFDRARAAAEVGPRRVHHLEDAGVRSFLAEVGEQLAPTGHFALCTLRVDDDPIAARLVYRSGASAYFAFSAFDPAWADYSPGAVLMAECLRWATTRGCSEANLSIGIDPSKVRWSETVRTWHTVSLVNDRPRSRVAYSAYWSLRASALSRRLLHATPAGPTP
jgi:CelD/BcsL family acetyltransferase involved in cellulose biosynthesis